MPVHGAIPIPLAASTASMSANVNGFAMNPAAPLLSTCRATSSSGNASFNQDIGAWDVSRVMLMTSMFYDVTLSTANYDSMLLGWGNLAVRNDVVFHADNARYSSATASAREQLAF